MKPSRLALIGISQSDVSITGLLGDGSWWSAGGETDRFTPFFVRKPWLKGRLR